VSENESSDEDDEDDEGPSESAHVETCSHYYWIAQWTLVRGLEQMDFGMGS